MNDLPWFPWSNEYREDEWFLSLTCGQRWAWVALLSRANETAWVLRDNLLRALRVTARGIGGGSSKEVLSLSVNLDIDERNRYITVPTLTGESSLRPTAAAKCDESRRPFAVVYVGV